MDRYRKWLIMAIVSVSGGLIFMLPFLQEVYYIPLAQALDLNNTQVGSLMSIFGTVSMLSYFPGGWLADRIAPRKLLSASLLASGLLGSNPLQRCLDGVGRSSHEPFSILSRIEPSAT